MTGTPRHALVRFCKEIKDIWDTLQDPEDYPDKDDVFVFLCHVYQMPGHCMLIRLGDNKIFGPFHTENFEDIPEEEC